VSLLGTLRWFSMLRSQPTIGEQTQAPLRLFGAGNRSPAMRVHR